MRKKNVYVFILIDSAASFAASMDVIISTSLLSTPTSRAVQALPPSSPALLAPRLALGKVLEFRRAAGAGAASGGGGATSGSSSSSSSPGSRPPLGAAEAAAASVFLESPRAPGALHTCPAAGCGYSTSVRSTYHRHLRCHPAQKAAQACDSGGGGGGSGGRERERERAACCSESGGCGAMHCSGSSEGGASAELELEAASEAFRAGIMAMRETDRTDQRALDARRAAAAAAGHPEPEFAFEGSASV
jgi:hypothetical protein